MSDFYTIGKMDISDLYSRIRTQHQRELDARKREIFAKVPELAELEKTQSEQNAGFLKRLISLPQEEREEAKKVRRESSARITARMTELLTSAGYSADALQMSYDCPICRDEGVVDGQRCSCYNKRMLTLLYQQSSMGDVLERENFGTFSLDFYSRDQEPDGRPSPYHNMEGILKKVKDYTQHAKEKPASFLFYGESGLGKTFLTHCIAKELMEQGLSVLYLTANELFQQVLSPYLMSQDNELKEALQPVFHLVYQADLLVLDDLGTELTNSFTLSQLFEVINRRSLDNRATIISTNLSLEQLGERYQDRILYRILERYELCRIYGENIRIRIAAQKYNNR